MTDSAPAPIAPPPVRYIGDDWSFPYTYQNADGTPVDITSATPIATLFARDQVAPALVMQGEGVTIVDAPNGKVVFMAPAAVTATLRADGNAEGYPTRVQYQLRAAGLLTTSALAPVAVDDPRFAPLGC